MYFGHSSGDVFRQQEELFHTTSDRLEEIVLKCKRLKNSTT
jgi:hypothetical protein